MANEVITHVGRPGKLAAEALALGDVIALDADGKFAKTAAGAAAWYVALGPAAVDEKVTGVRETGMKAMVTAVANIAVGDDLYVGVGALTDTVTGPAVAKAAEAVAIGSAVAEVMF